MRIEVAGSPEHENVLDEYAFTFNAGTLRLSLVGYSEYVRPHETGEWRKVRFWQYPDIGKHSTMKEPAPPDWAIADAKTYILTQIKC
jgi:hypothetical protein